MRREKGREGMGEREPAIRKAKKWGRGGIREGRGEKQNIKKRNAKKEKKKMRNLKAAS